MRSSFPGREGPAPADRLIDAFEALWRQGEPSLGDFWDEFGGTHPPSILVALVKIDIRNRFDRGESPSVAPYLERFPVLKEDRDQVVSLVYEEFCLREERGDSINSQEFCAAYEPWRDSLLSQLAYHRSLSMAIGHRGKSPRLPASGERFGRYTLGRMLGQGGVARVFIATQDELEGREVALKITPRVGSEGSILAKLDHPNIVSLYTLTDPTEDGLRGISMPYRPGITLDLLIQEVRSKGLPRTARGLRDLLDASRSETTTESDLSEWDDFPARGTYYDAVAWIGLCMANALTHAHEHGILHRDVKPGNILMAFREGPQLFDFNLADDPKAPEEAKAAHKGGTLPYMAPEHLRSFLDPAAWGNVGPAADLFSLGLVLRELATGHAPDLPSPSLPLARAIQALIDRRAEPLVPAREINRAIPPALESILARCLAFDRGRRYPNASDLAEDLRRFLGRRPLKHAPNTSSVERARNLAWRSRRKLLTTVVLATGLAVVGWLGWPRTPFHQTRAFADAVADLNAGRIPAARAAFAGFYKDNHNSAWSQLYYGLSLLKSGGKHLIQANELIKSFPKSPDAEAAIKHRLEVDPNSSVLLVALGMTYQLQVNSPGVDKLRLLREARDAFDRASKGRPTQALSFILLAGVEVDLGDLASAVGHFERGIDLAERANGGQKSSETLVWRQHYVMALSNLADQLLRGSLEEPANRQRIAKLLAEMDANLPDLRSMTWPDDQIKRFGWNKEAFLAYFTASLLQGRAALASAEGKHPEAKELLRQAQEEISKARRAMSDKPEIHDREKQLRGQDPGLTPPGP